MSRIFSIRAPLTWAYTGTADRWRHCCSTWYCEPSKPYRTADVGDRKSSLMACHVSDAFLLILDGDGLSGEVMRLTSLKDGQNRSVKWLFLVTVTCIFHALLFSCRTNCNTNNFWWFLFVIVGFCLKWTWLIWFDLIWSMDGLIEVNEQWSRWAPVGRGRRLITYHDYDDDDDDE